MIDERYYIKIVPHKGESVHRFEVRRRHIIASLAAIVLVLVGTFGLAAVQIARARSAAATFARETATSQAALKRIDKQADALRSALQRVQKQNQEIRGLIGVPVSPRHSVRKMAWVRGRSFKAAALRIRALDAVSSATTRESDINRNLALHVLNIRHIHSLVRAQMIAAIPSIDPVAGAQIVGCFCYRTYPDVEFHEGVDLGADYGDAVRAAAAGTVVSAGWEAGGFGIKIDIDHGNGYHTWYAHLSSVDVHPGEHVYKGETIAAVGSTGFSTGPHLHYQVMHDGVPVNPTPFLSGIPSNVLASLP
ncbi:MAG: M23 family metallopeptidase [Vulcanimicrobiaceae bacterium]